MTGRTKSITTRIEAEIERSREESNWLRVIALAEQLKEKSRDYECLADFLTGEAKLENFLEEYPPVEENINHARLGLIEAKRHLQSVTGEAGIRSGVSMDAHLLLGKLQYACGNYADGLASFHKAELHNLSEKKLPIRSLKIVAESYAVKALCLQKDKSASTKYKKASKEEEIIKCFDLASDLGLLYMQERERDQSSFTSVTGGGTHSPQPQLVQKPLGVLIEQALQEAPAFLISQGKHLAALERFRANLCAIESFGVNTGRLKFMCQMAELLLQGITGDEYKPPNSQTTRTSIWKPSQYASLNQFNPTKEYEEILLVLLVAESMAVRDAVLSQSPEFKEARVSAYQEATNVYDLLTIATVRWGQTALLQESLERSMKFSFKEAHLWRQHALSLICIARHEHALNVLREAVNLEDTKSINCLLAARLCYEHLNRPLEGIEFCMEAKRREIQYPNGLLARCLMFAGIGYHLRARECVLKNEKEDADSKALENFRNAVQIEPNDHLCEYYLGLQLAHMSRINEALGHVHTAMALQPEKSSTLHLLVLLLSANRQHAEALQVVESALLEFPDCLNLMYVKANLQLHEEGGEKALSTARNMLELWKNLHEGQTSSDVPECDRKSDTRSVFQLYTSEMSDKDSSSLQLHSAAASRVEQALSEVASSMSSFNPRPGPQRAWIILLEIWLLLAELYLSLDQTPDVLLCIQEATQIFPPSHHIMHMRGLLHMHKKEWLDAKLCFQNAVAINPRHVKSLQQLGLVYHYMGLQGLAESTLREAARIDPLNHVTWYNLGKVLESLGEFETASDAMDAALSIETTSPILPFSSVPLCFE